MAATLDLVRTLEAREEHGVVTFLRREALVTGLTNTDYRVLWSALADAGIPAVGETPTGEPNLRLTQRTTRVVPASPDKCFVELTYEHFLNAGQTVSKTATVKARLRGSLTQQTERAVKRDEAEGTETEISLTHTWPETDPDYPSDTDAIPQVPTVTAYRPHKTLTVEGIMNAVVPDVFMSILGYVNKDTWAGGSAGTWLCTSAEGAEFEIGVSYRVRFEFQYDPAGWDQAVWFIDKRTGRPPPDLAATGYATAHIYDRIRFQDYFSV
jgi:hypothetical protein